MGGPQGKIRMLRSRVRESIFSASEYRNHLLRHEIHITLEFLSKLSEVANVLCSQLRELRELRNNRATGSPLAVAHANDASNHAINSEYPIAF